MALIWVNHISISFGGPLLLDGASLQIEAGERIGLLGRNSSGKTTLLKVLLGLLAASGGKIRLGAGVAVAYFDQLRAQFDEAKSLRDNIADGNDTVFINGAPRRVVGYLQDFLFPPAQILAPVASLSGGERNRLLLAKLFCIPSNVLVLDEPTNDLDAETLELLEERLLEYGGTIMLVSHDRTFLNNVVTSTIVLEGEGRLQEYVGGYDGWMRQRIDLTARSKAVSKEAKPKKERQAKEKSKLSFKETRKLEELPSRIGRMEKEKAELLELLNSPDLYKTHNPARALDVNNRLAALETDLTSAYDRWDALEELAAKFSS